MAVSAEGAVVIAPPALDEPLSASTAHEETAVFAGGCFWGVQGVFQHVRGVTRAVSGYSGGTRDTAEYEIVSGGETGHAESVQVTFDPTKVSYGQLLQVYFSVDPRPDRVEPAGAGQRHAVSLGGVSAERRPSGASRKAYIAQLEKAHAFAAPIVTRVGAVQGLLSGRGLSPELPDAASRTTPYIVINDLPKVANLKRVFPNLYRDKPVLVEAAQ